MADETEWVPVYHGNGCCGLVFYYDHVPRPTDPILPEHAVLPDGTKPNRGDPLECQICGRRIGPRDLRPERMDRSDEETATDD